MKLNALNIALSAVLLFMAFRAAGEGAPEKREMFVVHEWGVQIRSQIVVHDQIRGGGKTEDKPRNLLSAPRELIAGLPPFVLRHDKEFTPAPMSREWAKPVLHFYGPEGLECSVKVLTPKGRPLAYWPKPELLLQNFWQMSQGLSDAVGMSWQAKLSAQPSGKPAQVEAGQWWLRVREVPARWLNTAWGSERFIFYEASAVQEPVLVAHVSETELTVENRHSADSGPIVILTNDGLRRNFVCIPNVVAKSTLKLSKEELLASDGAEQKLLAACQAQWEAFGMTRQEAQAIVDTWKPDLLNKLGFLVMARMPAEIYDTLFPLEIIPKPDLLVRAGVVFDTLPGEDARAGWLPNLAKVFEPWSNDLAADSFEKRAEAVQRFEAMGDLAKPFLQKLSKSVDPEVQSSARLLLSRLQPGILLLPAAGRGSR